MRARVIQLDVLISAQAVLRALAGMPAFVIELKPLWLYAWRAQLAAEGFTVDFIDGGLNAWAEQSLPLEVEDDGGLVGSYV